MNSANRTLFTHPARGGLEVRTRKSEWRYDLTMAVPSVRSRGYRFTCAFLPASLALTFPPCVTKFQLSFLNSFLQKTPFLLPCPLLNYLHTLNLKHSS